MPAGPPGLWFAAGSRGSPASAAYTGDSRTRDQAVREHELLLTALERGDSAEYKRIAAEHRKNSETHLLRVMQLQPFLQQHR
jgi:DNA-binding GntR family transcriptional regulator